jgi:hypothetical protein
MERYLMLAIVSVNMMFMQVRLGSINYELERIASALQRRR